MYQYNPGYNRWSTDPAGPHQLVMPIDVADQFVAATQRHGASQADRVRWKRHKVKNGEAISQIAQKVQYDRVDTSVRPTIFKGNTIRAGHHLMIPVATKPLSAYSKSADARLARKSRTANARAIRSNMSFAEWRELLDDLAQATRVTHRQLAAWNGMAPGDTLSAVGHRSSSSGRMLRSKRLQPRTSRRRHHRRSANTTRKLRYTVRNGDSLYLIANKFRVTIDADWHAGTSIDKNKILRPGQKLTMYVDVTAQSVRSPNL